jgi:hypothetical protein
MALIATIRCPGCKRVVARLHKDRSGPMVLEHRQFTMARSRGGDDRWVVSRQWRRVEIDGVTVDGMWAADCEQITRCGTRIVIEGRVLPNLVRQHNTLGGPVKWMPKGAELDRSHRLLSAVTEDILGSPPGDRPAEYGRALQVARIAPPPLTNVTRTRGLALHC